jgi:hypothetical protein
LPNPKTRRPSPGPDSGCWDYGRQIHYGLESRSPKPASSLTLEASWQVSNALQARFAWQAANIRGAPTAKNAMVHLDFVPIPLIRFETRDNLNWTISEALIMVHPDFEY